MARSSRPPAKPVNPSSATSSNGHPPFVSAGGFALAVSEGDDRIEGALEVHVVAVVDDERSCQCNAPDLYSLTGSVVTSRAPSVTDLTEKAVPETGKALRGSRAVLSGRPLGSGAAPGAPGGSPAVRQSPLNPGASPENRRGWSG